ncbi:hypothetical protein L3Q82_002721 [Scortum barcoo]|uniref:Uncharacterized protein n=1 Tax=Scortum barcoo TaxID=214431 RepID=A0ACB8VUB8_9TELE|nr:hypothetical protein L3Q82_002721 [Scortum barcoo]
MLGTLCTLITALTCVSGVTVVTVVTQKPPVVTVRKGETATMDCNLGTVTNYGARWYKQIPGGVPQFVLKFHHSDRSPKYGSGFSSPKFTSTHQSRSDYRLIIKNVEEGDSAVYHCSTYGTALLGRRGAGAFLSYLGRRQGGSSLPPPVLTVFPPSSAELQSNKASLVCLSSQSVPFADVSWLSGGSPVSSGISTSTAVQQADRTFQISSYLAIQTSDWNMDKVYTCVSGVTVLTQKPPVVTVRKGETATMDCNLGTVTDSGASLEGEVVYQGSSSSEKTVKVRAMMGAGKKSTNTSFFLNKENKDENLQDVDAVIVLTQTPAVHTVSTGQEVVLRCNIQRYDNVYVYWYKQVPGEAPQFVLRFYHGDSSLVFGSGFSSDRFNSKSSSNIDYQFIIKRSEAGDSAVYYCSSLPPPVLTVFPPSSAELQSNKASLVCLSSQSVPFADVSWLSGGSPVSSGISTSTAVQQADRTFQISSYLAIQTSDWNMDKVYTCVSGVTVLTQKPPVVTVRKGETATMDCNLGTVTDSGVRLYKQIPGGVPQFILDYIHGWSSPKYGSGFSSPKFTSTHQSTTDYRLIINNVEEGDSAVYYCKTFDSSVNEYVSQGFTL